MNTAELIASLSMEPPKPRLYSPGYWIASLIAVLVFYSIGIQMHLGFRPDLQLQSTRFGFVAELSLLLTLIISSVIASVLAMYPDMYQKPWLLKLPFWTLVALIVLILIQLEIPTDVRMVFPPPGGHGIECTICIASTSFLPSAIIFILLRKGASIHPYQAGSLAVLTSSGIGCLTLRLAEANDSLIHLATFHYLPTVMFGLVGAWIGRFVLKW